MKKVYVLGFIFSMSMSQVVLATKRTPVDYQGEGRPDWMNGFLNGVGGVMQPGESIEAAIQRKTLAETDIATDPGRWQQFAVIQGEDYVVHILMYKATDKEFYTLQTKTDEPVKAYNVSELARLNVAPNLNFIIPLATMQEAEPSMVYIGYGEQVMENAKHFVKGLSIPGINMNQGGGGNAHSLEGGAENIGGGSSEKTTPNPDAGNPEHATTESPQEPVHDTTAKIADMAAGDTKDDAGKPTANAARPMDAGTRQKLDEKHKNLPPQS